MYKVQVKGAGVKIAGKWKFKGEIAETTKEEYEANKEFVEVIEVAKEENSKRKLVKTTEGE